MFLSLLLNETKKKKSKKKKPKIIKKLFNLLLARLTAVKLLSTIPLNTQTYTHILSNFFFTHPINKIKFLCNLLPKAYRTASITLRFKGVRNKHQKQKQKTKKKSFSLPEENKQILLHLLLNYRLLEVVCVSLKIFSLFFVS